MSTLSRFAPKYCKHKASGQAVVSLNGKDHYLGPHGTAVSKREYDRLVGESLKAVERLRKGRTDAAECRRVPAADTVIVDATLPHLPPIIAPFASALGTPFAPIPSLLPFPAQAA